MLFIVTGVISFSFAFVGFSSLTQLFNPFIWTTSFFEFLEVLALRRIRGTDTIPVYRGTIEDGLGREQDFMLRGSLRLGNLVIGHQVRLNGQWRSGTLLVQGGENLTTTSTISINYQNPWKRIFGAVLCFNLILALIILIFSSGIG